MVDQAIATAAATTPVPNMGEGFNTWATATLDPYAQVADASAPSKQISSEDLTQAEISQALLDNQVLTPSPSWTKSAGRSGNVSMVPYDMKLGASIMSSLTSAQATVSPPPTQQIVSEQFVAQCPMIMFGSNVYISAPTCGDTMGEWEDPPTGRSILHWQPQGAGGVRFGVDSVVNGNGSVTFATTDQQLSLEGTYFELNNCMKVMRYTIEQEVIKVNNIGIGVTSTVQEHDIHRTSQAFFYRYTIKAPNGSAVAQTSLYRMGQTQINVTMMTTRESEGGQQYPEGALLAIADKSGTWSGADWKQCTGGAGTKRRWQVSFQLDERNFETVATVMDLRVATAAMITLMAFRDETTSVKTGVSRTGEKSMLVHFFTAAVIGIIAAFLFLVFVVVLKRQGWDMKCRRLCFKFERAAMPHRPAFKRNAPYPTTY